MTSGTREADRGLKTELRRQVASAGLGQRLANSWRHYPNQKLDAVSLDGFYQAQLIRELAVRHITGWTGVELEGGPAPPTPENVAAVMDVYPVGERFFQEFTLRQVLLNAAKNGSGLSAAGTSSRVEGPNTAEPAATTTCPVPEARPEPTARLCPYREHALISHQEHEAWDVLLACQGQLRLAQSGHVIGIDMDAALGIAAARGCDLAVLAELVQRPRPVWSRRCRAIEFEITRLDQDGREANRARSGNVIDLL